MLSKVCLAGLPDNGPNAARCGGDYFLHVCRVLLMVLFLFFAFFSHLFSDVYLGLDE